MTIDPGLLVGTLSGMSVQSPNDAAEQELLRALAARTQAAAQEAQGAQQQYQGLAGAPPPSLSGLEAFVPTLAANIAATLARDPSYRDRNQQNLGQQRQALLQSRAQNLQSLRDIYSQKAEAAQKSGDLEATEKFRLQQEKISNTHEKILESLKLAGQQEKAKADREHDFALEAFKQKGQSAGDAGASPTLSPEGLDLAATQYALYGNMVPMGMGKVGAQVRSKIINRAAELFPNANPTLGRTDVAAERSALTNLVKMRSAVTAFEKTAIKNADLAISLMKKIPDAGAQWLNTPLRAVSVKGLGSAELAAYNTALRTIIPEFARILANPNLTGQLTDTARHEIENVLSPGATLNQIVASIDVLKRDAQNRGVSLDEEITATRSRLQNIGREGGAAPAPAGTTQKARVMVVDPKGKRFEIDADELPEAIKNGWKRAGK